jgi:hypothetical protein
LPVANYISNAGAGHNEMKHLENGNAVTSVDLIRKLSADSQDRNIEETADVSALDVSQIMSCPIKIV